jgi:TolB-like protein/DNA-binding winged helix-turn-helix (wHTH) protein
VDDSFRVGAWLVQPDLNTVSSNGTKVRVEPKVMEVLVCLASHAGEPVRKETLLRTVWPDTFVSDDVLIRSVSELRRVFEDDAREPRFIETIPKRGYRLVAPMERLNGSAPAFSSPRPVGAGAEQTHPRWRWSWSLTAVCVGCLILLLGLLFFLNAGGLRARVFGSNNPAIRSIAVLPLKNLSDDPSQKYFASGMTEELITDLSQISALKVISRTSSEVYENTHKSLPEIARELNVDAVIEGSVERSGDRVRIMAQLIYAPQDKNLWARSYDRDLRDALALQGTLATAIADEIRVQVAPNVQARMNAPNTISVSVLDAYLQGNYHLHRVRQGTVDEEDQKAAQDFQRAIDEDPSFAPAYIGLAYAHSPILAGYGLLNPSLRDYEARKAAVEKAVELAPDSSEAHDLLASVYCEDWKWSQAEEELQRAIALSPNSADAHDTYGMFLFAIGRPEEGMKESKIAQELDPKVDHMADALQNSGRNDEAISLLLRDLERDPDNNGLHVSLFMAYSATGRDPETIR